MMEGNICAGLRNSKSGYESLVEAAGMVSRNFDPIKQCELVIEALDRAFPSPILYLVSPPFTSSG